MKPFDDPDASRPTLPTDVLAYVARMEALPPSRERHPNDVDRTQDIGVPTLCRIVREQATLLDQAIAAADVAATALEMCASENDALRERLAKLEAAAQDVVTGIESKEMGISRGCTDNSCEGRVCGPVRQFWARVEALRLLLKDKST